MSTPEEQPDRSAELVASWADTLERLANTKTAIPMKGDALGIVAALLVVADALDFLTDTWRWTR